MGTSEQREADFAAFVAAQSAQLVHFARLLCGDLHTAQDLVQAALEKVYNPTGWQRVSRDEVGTVTDVVPFQVGDDSVPTRG